MRLSRRSLLRGAAAGAALGGLATAGPMAAPALAGPAPAPGFSTGQTSANGWRVGPGRDIHTFSVPGTDVSVALRGGDVAVVLVHVVRRFHYEIDALRDGEVVGYEPAGTVPARHETNHSSGTAVDIRAAWYPLGTAGGFFPHQQDVLRDILAECEGVVRWGGDLDPVDESHFQIDVPPGDARLHRLATKIRGWRERPGRGAGVLVDPLAPPRRTAALSLARRQRLS